MGGHWNWLSSGEKAFQPSSTLQPFAQAAPSEKWVFGKSRAGPVLMPFPLLLTSDSFGAPVNQ